MQLSLWPDNTHDSDALVGRAARNALLEPFPPASAVAEAPATSARLERVAAAHAVSKALRSSPGLLQEICRHDTTLRGDVADARLLIRLAQRRPQRQREGAWQAT